MVLKKKLDGRFLHVYADQMTFRMFKSVHSIIYISERKKQLSIGTISIETLKFTGVVENKQI